MNVELAQLRRARESNNSTVLSPPATIIVTNEVRTVIEKLVPTPAPPPVVKYVTNTERVFVTNRITAATASAPPLRINGLKAVERQATSTNGKAATQSSPVTNSLALTKPINSPLTNNTATATTVQQTSHQKAEASHTQTSHVRRGTVMVSAIGGGTVLVFLALLAYIASLRGRPYVVSLSVGGEKRDFALAARDECLPLDSNPIPAPSREGIQVPSIHIRWRGAFLQPGNLPTTVNDLQIPSDRRLKPGDRIIFASENGITHNFEFLACEPAHADEEMTSSATTEVNI